MLRAATSNPNFPGFPGVALSKGPTCVDELFAWPCSILPALFHKEVGAMRRQRLRALLSDTVAFTTDYSGIDCPKEALRAMDVALNDAFYWPVGDGERQSGACSSRFRFVRPLRSSMRCMRGPGAATRRLAAAA